MDEIKQEVATDVASEEVVADETAAQASENTGKKKIKLPAWLQKLVDKIKSNEDVRQMVVFTLFSFICGRIATYHHPRFARAFEARSRNQRFESKILRLRSRRTKRRVRLSDDFRLYRLFDRFYRGTSPHFRSQPQKDLQLHKQRHHLRHHVRHLGSYDHLCANPPRQRDYDRLHGRKTRRSNGVLVSDLQPHRTSRRRHHRSCHELCGQQIPRHAQLGRKEKQEIGRKRLQLRRLRLLLLPRLPISKCNTRRLFRARRSGSRQRIICRPKTIKRFNLKATHSIVRRFCFIRKLHPCKNKPFMSLHLALCLSLCTIVLFCLRFKSIQGTRQSVSVRLVFHLRLIPLHKLRARMA